MSNPFLCALLAEPPVILGRRVLPFSLAHAMILRGLDNPLWVGGSPVIPDVAVCVVVCSHTWEGFRALFNSGGLPREVLRLSRRWPERSFVNAAHQLNAYITDGLSAADREQSSGKAHVMATPWEYRLAVFLMGVGWSESAAWNCPVNRARAYFDAKAESDGDTSIISDRESRAYELIAEANALVKAGRPEGTDAMYSEAEVIFRETRGQ